MNRTGKLTCALLIMALAVGCSTRQVLTTLGVGAAVGAGVAGVYYVKGDLESNHDNNIGEVHRASMSTMQSRGYTVTQNDLDAAAGRIDAEIPAVGTDKARDLTIKLTRKERDLTHISIRVGIFGDEALSQAILDDIEARL